MNKRQRSSSRSSSRSPSRSSSRSPSRSPSRLRPKYTQKLPDISVKVHCVAYHPTKPLLATGCEIEDDKYTVMLWQLNEQNPPRKIHFEKPENDKYLHKGLISFITFHPKLDILASCSYNEPGHNVFATLKLWNYQSDYTGFKCTQTLIPARGDIYSIAFHPIDPVIAIGCEYGVRLYNQRQDEMLWDVSTFRGYNQITEIENPFYSVAFIKTKDGSYLFFGGKGGIVKSRFWDSSKLWDPSKLMPGQQAPSKRKRGQQEDVTDLINEKTPDEDVSCIALYPKAPIMVTGSTDGNVKVWWLSRTEYNEMRAQPMHTIYENLEIEIKCIAFHPTEPYLAIGYANKVGIFRFECLSTLSITNFPIYTCESDQEVVSLAFSASPSRMLAIATQSKNVVLLDYKLFRLTMHYEYNAHMKEFAHNGYVSIPASKVQKNSEQLEETMWSVVEDTIELLPPTLPPMSQGGKSRNKRKATRKRYTKKQRGRR
jgi:WD40 repeat protein